MLDILSLKQVVFSWQDLTAPITWLNRKWTRRRRRTRRRRAVIHRSTQRDGAFFRAYISSAFR